MPPQFVRVWAGRLPTLKNLAIARSMAATLTEILIPLVAPLGAALIAGVASYFAGRGMRSHEWKLGLVRERLLERQKLYATFLSEVDRNLLLVVVNEEKSIDNLMSLLAAFAEISLLSSQAVTESARQLCDIAISSIGRDTAGLPDGHFVAKTEFLETARAELEALEAGAGKSAP